MNRTSSPSMTLTRTGLGLNRAWGTAPASGLELTWAALGSPKKISARRKGLQTVGLMQDKYVRIEPDRPKNSGICRDGSLAWIIKKCAYALD